MSLFNTEAAGDVKLFRENNDKYAKRAADIIRAGGASMDLQLIKDFIAIQGLDLVADKDKIIHICKEIGVEPKALGIEIEEPTPEISRENDDIPKRDNDGIGEK